MFAFVPAKSITTELAGYPPLHAPQKVRQKLKARTVVVIFHTCSARRRLLSEKA